MLGTLGHLSGTLGCHDEAYPGLVDRFDYTSTHIGDTFAVDVYQPASPAPNTGWQVLYVLDGTLHGDDVARWLYDNNKPVVTVAVGYVEADHEHQRVRDYTPTTDSGVAGSGGAQAHLEFLSKEVLPFVEERYPVGQRGRALLGHDLGGLFAAHVLLNQPERRPWFDRFALASPRLDWDGGVMLDLEAQAAAERELAATLDVGFSDVEPVGVTGYGNAVIERLRARRYELLEIRVARHEHTLPEDSWALTYVEALALWYGNGDGALP